LRGIGRAARESATMKTRTGFARCVAAAAIAMAASGAACAQGWGPPDQIMVYGGQGVDHNLTQLPGAILRDRIRWEDAHFAGIAVDREAGSLGDAWSPLKGTWAGGVRYGYEALLIKHWGRQHNGEVGAALTLRTPALQFWRIGVDAMVGGGLSYAMGRPSYEDGPDNDPTKRYRLQFMAIFEVEWRLAGLDRWSLVTRAQHRSGIYGIIAPRHVGSNFLAAGVRYRF
jgi:hypothetical protein